MNLLPRSIAAYYVPLLLFLYLFQYPIYIVAQSSKVGNVQSPSIGRQREVPQNRVVIEVVKFQELQTLIEPNTDTVRVINFWATSCRPCIEEMPDFERLHREYSIAKEGMKPVQVVFVSLDFRRDVTSKVIPFIKKRGLTARCVFLGMPKSDEIDAIEGTWTGSMPATLIVGTKLGRRMFYERKMSYEELKDFVKTYLFP